MFTNIGEHEHEVTVFDSYETYAVCRLCGMHDWSMPGESEKSSDYFSYDEIVQHYFKKYPKNPQITHLT